MDKSKRTAQSLIAGAGALMTVSGILMMLSGRVAIGGVFWASAACMFLTAYHFRTKTDKTDAEEKDK